MRHYSPHPFFAANSGNFYRQPWHFSQAVLLYGYSISLGSFTAAFLFPVKLSSKQASSTSLKKKPEQKSWEKKINPRMRVPIRSLGRDTLTERPPVTDKRCASCKKSFVLLWGFTPVPLTRNRAGNVRGAAYRGLSLCR